MGKSTIALSMTAEYAALSEAACSGGHMVEEPRRQIGDHTDQTGAWNCYPMTLYQVLMYFGYDLGSLAAYLPFPPFASQPPRGSRS